MINRMIHTGYPMKSKNKLNLNSENIFVFGIKPKSPTSNYGYFLTKKIKGNINKVTKFIEKPKEAKAKQVIKQKGYWNSGMFIWSAESIITAFEKHLPEISKLFSEITNELLVEFTV